MEESTGDSVSPAAAPPAAGDARRQDRAAIGHAAPAMAGGAASRAGALLRGALSDRRLLVGALIVVAFGVRVWAARHSRLSPEEAHFWSTGLGIARLEGAPILGHPISGSAARHPGAMFFWLVALSQLVWASPVAANLFTALFGLVALVLFSRAVAQCWSPRAGTIMLALGAASPWWVVYSNSAWPSYLVPSLCALLVAGLVHVVANPRSRAVGPTAFLLITAFQIHLSLLHFWFLALAMWALFRPRLNRRWLWGGLLLGAACYLPYLVAELRSGFANTRLILVHSQGGPRKLSALWGLLLYFLGFPTTDIGFLWNQGFWFPFDPVRFWLRGGVARTSELFRGVGPVWFSWVIHLGSWLLAAAGLLFGAARGVAALRARRTWRVRPDPLAALVVVALLDVVVFYALSGKGGYAHYVNVALPLAFIPTVALLDAAARRRWLRLAAAAYLILLPLASLLVLQAYYRVDSRLSAPQTEAVVRFVLERTRDAGGAQRPFELRFGFSPAWPYPYAVIASRLYQARWPVQSGARDVFHVGVREAEPPAAPAAARLDLETISVRHEVRAAPP